MGNLCKCATSQACLASYILYLFRQSFLLRVAVASSCSVPQKQRHFPQEKFGKASWCLGLPLTVWIGLTNAISFLLSFFVSVFWSSSARPFPGETSGCLLGKAHLKLKDEFLVFLGSRRLQNLSFKFQWVRGACPNSKRVWFSQQGFREVLRMISSNTHQMESHFVIWAWWLTSSSPCRTDSPCCPHSRLLLRSQRSGLHPFSLF